MWNGGLNICGEFCKYYMKFEWEGVIGNVCKGVVWLEGYYDYMLIVIGCFKID